MRKRITSARRASRGRPSRPAGPLPERLPRDAVQNGAICSGSVGELECHLISVGSGHAALPRPLLPTCTIYSIASYSNAIAVGRPTMVILGVDVPDDRPVFIVALGVHIVAGLTCVISGALAATATKRKGRHPRAGVVYYWAITVVAATAGVMA